MSWADRIRWRTTSWGLLQSLTRSSNAAAWCEFDRGYAASIRAYCLAQGLQHADAEDVVQRVFLDLSQHIGNFEYQPSRAKFRSWLMVVIRRAIGKLRRKSKGREVTGEGLETLPGPTLGADFAEAILEVALKQIQPEFTAQEWIAFERSWRQDDPAPQIAQDLDWKIGQVYRVKSLILHRLKEQVATLAADIPWPPDARG